MKKLLSIVVAVVLTMTFFATTICAAGSVGIAASAQPGPGEIFMTNITLNQNPGITYIQCKVTFADETMTLIGCTDSGLFDDFQQYIDPNDPGTLILTFTNNGVDNYSTGTIATLTFIAGNDVQMGALMSVESSGAIRTDGTAVTFDGQTTVVLFNTEDSSDDGDGFIFIEEDINEDDEFIEDEEEIIEDDEEVTTATEATTEKTTTKKTEKTTTETTKASTTTEQTTEATTTTPSVTTQPVTEEPIVTTPVVTDEQAPSGSASESIADDVQTPSDNIPVIGNEQGNKAPASTVAFAISILIIAVLLIAGIEIYKRYFKR